MLKPAASITFWTEGGAITPPTGGVLLASLSVPGDKQANAFELSPDEALALLRAITSVIGRSLRGEVVFVLTETAEG